MKTLSCSVHAPTICYFCMNFSSLSLHLNFYVTTCIDAECIKFQNFLNDQNIFLKWFVCLHLRCAYFFPYKSWIPYKS